MRYIAKEISFSKQKYRFLREKKENACDMLFPSQLYMPMVSETYLTLTPTDYEFFFMQNNLVYVSGIF